MAASHFQEIAASVEGWLHGEHDYQFAKFDSIYGEELVRRRDFIANTELANKWQRNVTLRKGEAYTLANQQVLKVCAAARAVIIYGACIEGADRQKTSDVTFEMINQHFKQLTESTLEPSLLYEQYENVFPDQNPEVIFKRAGELAILGITELETKTGEIILPAPGLSSGNI